MSSVLSSKQSSILIKQYICVYIFSLTNIHANLIIYENMISCLLATDLSGYNEVYLHR
jgi:hypothetical protein